jgi:hypothetical protein
MDALMTTHQRVCALRGVYHEFKVLGWWALFYVGEIWRKGHWGVLCNGGKRSILDEVHCGGFKGMPK